MRDATAATTAASGATARSSAVTTMVAGSNSAATSAAIRDSSAGVGRATPRLLPQTRTISRPSASCAGTSRMKAVTQTATRAKRTHGGTRMAKEELLEFDGMVTEVLPDGNFRVKLDNDHEILAYTAGKMRKFRIRTGVGDRVVVEMSPYDLQRGRISFRHKSAAPPMIGSGQRRPNYRR